MRPTRLLAALLMLLLWASPNAYAQPAALVADAAAAVGGPFSTRPLITPPGHLELILGPLSRSRIGDAGVVLTVFDHPAFDDDVLMSFIGGASYGITEDLDVSAILLPIQLVPGGEFEDPRLWGTYRFLDGEVEVAGRLGFTVPIDGDFAVGLGLPILIHFYGAALDIEPSLELREGGVDLEVPVRIVFDVGSALFLGLRSGLYAPEFGGDDATLPLYGLLGYGFQEGIDLTMSAGFPGFLNADHRDVFDFRVFTVALGLNFVTPL